MIPAAAIVAFAIVGTVQDAPPVFRADVDVVTVEISISTRTFGLISRPYTKLTVDDVTVIFEGKTYPAVRVEQDPKKAGRYLISFAPPDEYRDGQKHAYSVTLKIGRSRPFTFPPSTVVVPQRTEPADIPR